MFIQDEARKKVVLQALADDCSIAILGATTDKARSAMDLVREFTFPSSTVYRRINELVDVKLLVVEKIVVTDDGKKFSLYRSAVKEIRAEYRVGKVEIAVLLNEDVGSKLSRLWESMRIRK